jgi:hypothetical protein
LRDAVELEWAGIPSVAVVHHSMSGSAGAMARVSGMPDYPFLTVDYPHVPLAIWTPEEIAEVARDLAPRIVELLSDTAGNSSPASTDSGGSMTDSSTAPTAPAALQPAFDEVRTIISADGGDIVLTSVEDGTVNLRLVVEGASCAECILPRPLLEQVTLDIFQRGGTGVTAISIDDPRERPDFVASDH